MLKVFSKCNAIRQFNNSNEGIYFVKEGEEFWVETEDCFGGQLKTEKDLRPNIDASLMNSSTGPIVIEGAEEGDILCIEILDIVINSQGVMTASPGLGILGHHIKNYNTKIIPIKNNFAYFNEDIKLPIEPMIGVIGTAPKEGNFSCVLPETHGGNMDTREISVGSKVYLPIFIKGANLAIGDLHAAMGDGELSGTGIEIGGNVKLRVKLIKGDLLKNPRLETKDYLIIIASAKEFKDAIKIATEEMVAFLQKALKLNFEDAYRLTSAACHLKVSQAVNPLVTVKVCAPKKILGLVSFY